MDALLAQLCIRHELTLLTTDKDFTHAAALSTSHLVSDGAGETLALRYFRNSLRCATERNTPLLPGKIFFFKV